MGYVPGVCDQAGRPCGRMSDAAQPDTSPGDSAAPDGSQKRSSGGDSPLSQDVVKEGNISKAAGANGAPADSGSLHTARKPDALKDSSLKIQTEKVQDKPKEILKFGPNDLVYGPTAGRKLQEFQARNGGGKTLNDLTPHGPGTKDWIVRSIMFMEKALENNNKIHFDLTNIEDMDNVLNGKGKYGNSITAQELRFLRSNWSRYRNNVYFYINDEIVTPPWQRHGEKGNSND